MGPDCPRFRRVNQLMELGISSEIQGFCDAKVEVWESRGLHSEIFLSRTQKNSFHLLTRAESSAMRIHP